MFHPDRGRAREWRFRRGNEAHTIVPSAPLSFSDPESAVTAAVGGAGFVRTRAFTVEAQIAAGLLQPVLEDWNEGASWPVSILYPHRQPAAKIRAFVEFGFQRVSGSSPG
jgi:LysR family transcriptional regulator, regulator for bpeEF and oprC